MENQGALKNLLEISLRSLYSVEEMLEKALGMMADKAASEKLRDGLLNHQQETINQKRRLERIFDTLEIKPKQTTVEQAEGVLEKGKKALEGLMKLSFREKNTAMEALLQQSQEKVEHFKNTDILDYVIAIDSELIEQIEIVSYSRAISMTEQLGHREVTELLRETLKEEEKARNLVENIAMQESKRFDWAHAS